MGTPCLNGGSITGTINGSSINFGVVQGQVTVNYAGTISGSTMSGTYATSCGNAEGNWTAAKQYSSPRCQNSPNTPALSHS